LSSQCSEFHAFPPLSKDWSKTDGKNSLFIDEKPYTELNVCFFIYRSVSQFVNSVGKDVDVRKGWSCLQKEGYSGRR
jgi:hypothetical protein